MLLYHGTARYNLAGFLQSIARTRRRVYVKDRRPSFATTRSFEIASLFAIRRTPIIDFPDRVGVVLEFDGENLEVGDYEEVRDYRATLQDEHEVVVFNPQMLKLVAIWEYANGKWYRSGDLL